MSPRGGVETRQWFTERANSLMTGWRRFDPRPWLVIASYPGVTAGGVTLDGDELPVGRAFSYRGVRRLVRRLLAESGGGDEWFRIVRQDEWEGWGST